MATIARRWPALSSELARAEVLNARWHEDGRQGALAINDIHLSSCFDQTAEAALQARLIPENCDEAWLYGAGCGALPQALLARNALQRLHVVILNPSVFVSALRHYPNEHWLEDPRVELSIARRDTPLRTPFCTTPPELHLAQDEAVPLRDRIQLELDTLLINNRAREQQAHSKNIETNLKSHADDGDVAEVYGSLSGGAVSIVAAGPTLDYHYGFLSLPQPIIAVDRALKLILARGIKPRYVVSIDPHPQISDYLDIPREEARDITLVYSPSITPEAAGRWPGPRLVAYGNSDLYDQAREHQPREALHHSGSVIHPAVDLAIRMGAHRILLFGADFSFPLAKRHADGSTATGCSLTIPDGAWVHDWNGERVPTLPNLRGYLRDLEDYIAKHPQVRFYSFGEQGARIEGSQLIRIRP